MNQQTPAAPLTNRVALVTGGGSGIGRETALAFARAGAAVMVADINPNSSEETAALIRDAGGQAAFTRVDVTIEREVAAMVTTTLDTFGRLNCACNNAGILGAVTSIEDYDEATWDRVMAVNAKGVWLCLKHEIPVMVRQGGGAIVNIASIAGLIGTPSLPAYGASKHAVIGLTKSAALGYGARNIRVNAVCPAIIQTPMGDELLSAPGGVTVEATTAAQAIGRLGQPEDVAGAVVWLCSDAAAFITGIALPIDGGRTAR